MLTAIVLASVLLTSSPVPPGAGASPGDLAAYRAAAARAGTDADAAVNVRLALWCEAHGLDAERSRHLALALAADPANAKARGLSGLVADRGRWRSASDLAAATRSDEALNAALAEYNARREALPRPETAGAHWALALWCQARGLAPEAVAHFSAVTRLDPGRADAWQKLGCRRYRGRWLTEAQVRAEEADAQARRDADRRWREPLRQWWRDYVAREDPQSRSGFAAAFATSLEPPAVPTIVSLFAKGDAEQQLAEVRLLDRIDAPEASQELARLAVVGRDDEVRGQAADAIARRDANDAIEWLIGALHDPLRIDVHGAPGAVGVLEVEDEAAILQKTYRQRVVRSPIMPNVGVPAWILGPFSSSTGRNGPTARQKINRDVASARRVNARRESINERVGGVLAMVTSEHFGADPDTWRRWWSQEQGVPYYRTSMYDKPVIRRVSRTTINLAPPGSGHGRCFAKGTLVRTVLGPRPIEELQVGDRVLTSDVTTGALEVRPVVAVRHNPPSATLRLTLGSESLVSTPIHRFWKSGTGWVMARDLKPGDAVRAIGGVVRVVGTEPDAVQPVYNLEVAEGRSYFVGDRGVLVHDYSPALAVSVAFDAVPRTADLAGRSPGDRPTPRGRVSVLGPVAPDKGSSRESLPEWLRARDGHEVPSSFLS